MAEEVLRLGVDPRPGVRGMQQFRSASDATAVSADRLAASVTAIGGAIVAYSTARVVGSAVRATIEWESALTGVAKTVDGTTAEIAALGGELQQLSTEIPATTTQLASIAEAAGQLGIQREAILGFTRVMADLGVTTNLSATEAATSLARLANVMGTPQTEFDRMGATVVELGNNLATTEREIVAFSERMSGAGRIAGLSEANIFAIAGALSSVGVEAEAGGTAVQKALIDINTAVAQGGEELEAFAATAGMSSGEFRRAWRDDAGSTFTAFVEGLGKSGDRAAGILDDLGLANQRSVRAFLSLANAGPLLRDALDLANTAWAENTALVEESEKRYATLASQIDMAKNEIRLEAIELGEKLTPALSAALEHTDLLIDAVESLAIALTAVTAIAAAVWLGGMAVAASGTVVAIAALVLEINSLAAALALAQVAIGPVGWFVAGVTAIAGAVFLWKRRTEEQTAAQKEANAAHATGAHLFEARLQQLRESAKESDAAARATKELIEGQREAGLGAVDLSKRYVDLLVKMLEYRRRTEGAQEATEKFNRELRALTEEALEPLGRSFEKREVDLTEGFTEALREAQHAIAEFREQATGVIQLGEAFGLLGDKAAGALQDVVQIAAAIKNLQAIQAAEQALSFGNFLPIAGGVASLAGGLFGGGEDQEAAELRQAMKELRDATDRLRETYTGTPSQLRDALAAGLQTYFPDVQDFTPLLDPSRRQELESRSRTPGIGDIVDEYLEALERIRESFQGELEVRRLLAEGSEAEAEALAFRLRQEKELYDAVAAGWDDATIALLEQTQAAEAEAEATRRQTEELERVAEARERELAILQQQRAFGLDIKAREAALRGDERAALEIQLQAQAEAELARAQDLLDAGTITAEMFERLQAVLEQEVNRTLETRFPTVVPFDGVINDPFGNGLPGGDGGGSVGFGGAAVAGARRVTAEATVARSALGGISEASAVRIVDISRSQLSVLRHIARNTEPLKRLGTGGVRVDDMASSVDRILGQRAVREESHMMESRIP